MVTRLTAKGFPTLTTITHNMVLRAPSGLDAQTISQVAGYKRYPTMMSELSRQPGHKLGADMILPLMEAANSDAPLYFLARQRNGVFIKLSEVNENGSALMEGLAACIKEFGELASESAASFSDGVITRAELDRVTVEGHEAVEAIMRMLKLARKKFEENAS